MSAARSVTEIESEITIFESQFRPVQVPVGTENRRALQRAADAEAHARSCLRENIDRRLALLAELRKARRSASARRAAARRAADPEQQVRGWIYRTLRGMGFRREHRSGSGSAYYRHADTGLRVRVSDHEVPETDDRRQSWLSGGFTWSCNRLSLDEVTTTYQAARWLVGVRRAIRRHQTVSA